LGDALLETGSEGGAASRMALFNGMAVNDALETLTRAGCTSEATWAWGFPSGSSFSYACRAIADGVYIVLFYDERAREVDGMAMVYMPPDYSSTNNLRVVGVNGVMFNGDGSYTVAFRKPAPAAAK